MLFCQSLSFQVLQNDDRVDEKVGLICTIYSRRQNIEDMWIFCFELAYFLEIIVSWDETPYGISLSKFRVSILPRSAE